MATWENVTPLQCPRQVLSARATVDYNQDQDHMDFVTASKTKHVREMTDSRDSRSSQYVHAMRAQTPNDAIVTVQERPLWLTLADVLRDMAMFEQKYRFGLRRPRWVFVARSCPVYFSRRPTTVFVSGCEAMSDPSVQRGCCWSSGWGRHTWST